MVSATAANSAIGQSSDGDVGQAVALEQDAADDAQEMRQRQDFADHLRPVAACRGRGT